MTRRRTVRVSSPAMRTMLEHARRERPRECCGLLVGVTGRVTAAVPMRNLARSRTRYRVDPAAHIALQRVLRAIAPETAIVGVYHSHPHGRAVPSETDIAEALYPDWIHVIIGLRQRRPEARGFLIAAGNVRHVALRGVERLQVAAPHSRSPKSRSAS